MSERLNQCTEEIDIILIDETTVAQTERWLSACEHCAENSVIPFDALLDALTGAEPLATEYLMCRPARCPACSSRIAEKTLVAV